MATSTQLNKITDEISINAHKVLGDRLHKIILYGSYARGDYDSESDIDIMVLADVNTAELPKLKDKICQISSDVSLDNDITVSVFLKDRAFFDSHINILPFYKNIVSEGILIYG